MVSLPDSDDGRSEAQEGVLEALSASALSASPSGPVKGRDAPSRAPKTSRRTSKTYAVWECPVPYCAFGPGFGPAQGSISGLKRHVKAKHPEFDFGLIDWPANSYGEGKV